MPRNLKLWGAVFLVGFALVLAIANPDKIVAKRSSSPVQKSSKTEAVKKPAPVAAEQASPGAVIEEEEGR